MLKKVAKSGLKFAYTNGLVPVGLLEEPSLVGPDKDSIRSLKDKFKGKRCFIVGNGPSLNKMDLSFLKDEYSFAVNGIFYKTREMGFKPTFYTVEDTHVMMDNVEAINEYDTEYKFFPTIYKKFLKNRKNTIFFNMNRGFYEESSDNYCIPRFSSDCSKRLYCGQSVTIINLQLAFYMGFEEVYLIGMDFSYVIPKEFEVDGNNITSTGDDPNHFHPDYFGKGKKWHDPKLENVLASYKMSKLVYERFNRKIYNATAGGNLDVFERRDYSELFDAR